MYAGEARLAIGVVACGASKQHRAARARRTAKRIATPTEPFPELGICGTQWISCLHGRRPEGALRSIGTGVAIQLERDHRLLVLKPDAGLCGAQELRLVNP